MHTCCLQGYLSCARAVVQIWYAHLLTTGLWFSTAAWCTTHMYTCMYEGSDVAERYKMQDARHQGLRRQQNAAWAE